MSSTHFLLRQRRNFLTVRANRYISVLRPVGVNFAEDEMTDTICSRIGSCRMKNEQLALPKGFGCKTKPKKSSSDCLQWMGLETRSNLKILLRINVQSYLINLTIQKIISVVNSVC